MHFGKRRFEMVLDSMGDDCYPITLRALIPKKLIGALIGKQGYVHKQIQDIFKVHIYILAWGDHYGRLANVFGNASSVSGAWRDALFRMYGSHESLLYNQTFQITFIVPAPLVEHMIENKVLEKIYMETKIGIHLKRDPIPDTTDHLLTIAINSMDVSLLNLFEKAVYMLALEFQEHPEKVMSPYNVYYLPPPPEDNQHNYQYHHHYQQQRQGSFSNHPHRGGTNDITTTLRDQDQNSETFDEELYQSTDFQSHHHSSNSSVVHDDNTDVKDNERKKKMDIMFPLEVEDDQQWHEEFNNEPITPI